MKSFVKTIKELWKDRVSGERVKEKEIPAGGMLFLQRL